MRHKAFLISLFLSWLCSSCVSRPEGPPAILIEGASVLDGRGGPPGIANLLIEGDRIAALGEDVSRSSGSVVEVIDGRGLTLAPGFIDTHSHGDGSLHQNRDALAAVSQGITTIVVGQDGGSPVPLAKFFSDLEADPAAVNVASYAGHGTIRRRVMGNDFRRAAGPEEVQKMRELLAEEMASGAIGLGTGLEYDPGIYSETSEVVALAREAASWGGRYISHLRSEDRYFWDAVEEILTIGREAHLPVQISHVKLAMQSLHGQAERLTGLLDEARNQGIEISADLYPYDYWQSTLTVLFPERDFENREQAELATREITSPAGMLIPTYRPEPAYAGKTLLEIAELRGTDPATTLIDLIREAEKMRKRGIEDVESVMAVSMDEEDIAALMAWPHTNIATDGELMGAHPRGFGTYPRVLGRYVRERGALTLAEAVHKMTALAAEHMGIVDRGALEPGLKADLVLFDPETVLDMATSDEPHAPSIGIEKVWVNGELVYDGETTTGRTPGRVLRRGPGGVVSAGPPEK